ncbi:MAG: metallophosphoesterase, partial [Armatimonadota bacterium]
MARLVILHTSDIHNRLTPDRARFLHELRAELPESLILDSGDAIWAGNVFWRPGGEPVLDLMNAVPYDAMCMGNREFHFLRAGLLSKTSRARFPVLSANLRRTRNHGSDTRFLPCVVLERGGLRVGVFGLSVPCVTQPMLVRRFADYYFED